MIGQMLNSQKLPNGYTPAFLMTGTEANFSVLTFQTVGPESKLDRHCKNILRAQNVCYALQQKSLENEKSPNNPAYEKFQPGTFVLLRKKKRTASSYDQIEYGISFYALSYIEKDRHECCTCTLWPGIFETTV